MAKLISTKNYDLFEVLPFNRDVHRTKWLEASMKQHGFIPAYPLHVVKNGNGKFKIKAGHHRFSVAKSLNLPVYCIECTDNSTVYELEKATTTWSLSDYLTSFVRTGNHEYQEVKDFYELTGIPLSMCFALLAGHTVKTTGTELSRSVKSGAFKVKHNTGAYIIADLVLHCKRIGIEWATNGLFVQALARIATLPQFDVAEFKHKVSAHSFLMEKQPTLATFEEMIERVYNRQRKDKVPLAFLSNQAAKKRSAAKIA